MKSHVVYVYDFDQLSFLWNYLQFCSLKSLLSQLYQNVLNNYVINTSIWGLACRNTYIRGHESQRRTVLIKLQIQFFINNVEQFNVQQHLKLLYYY